MLFLPMTLTASGYFSEICNPSCHTDLSQHSFAVSSVTGHEMNAALGSFSQQHDTDFKGL